MFFSRQYIVLMTGGIKMKRLIENKASRLVNKTVLDFYGITLSPRIDLADMDKTVIHAIKQAMIFAVTHRYPDQYDWITDLLVDCVLNFVMHLDPQLVRGETKTDAQLLLWGNVATAIREFSATKYASSSLPTEAVVPYIVEGILIGLEKLIMGAPAKLPE